MRAATVLVLLSFFLVIPGMAATTGYVLPTPGVV